MISVMREFHLLLEGKFGVYPFDSKPSLSVSCERQIYTYFSCHATENVFTFLINKKNKKKRLGDILKLFQERDELLKEYEKYSDTFVDSFTHVKERIDTNISVLEKNKEYYTVDYFKDSDLEQTWNPLLRDICIHCLDVQYQLSSYLDDNNYQEIYPLSLFSMNYYLDMASFIFNQVQEKVIDLEVVTDVWYSKTLMNDFCRDMISSVKRNKQKSYKI